ncbi:MAG: metal ABC transporter solute-binding protein, Zn/Mn family [Mycobacterium sp.]
MLRRKLRTATAAAALVLPLAACSSGLPPGQEAAGACPVAPVDVVVSVNQWGSIVADLGGDCATVTTVVASSSLDPHDYEPSPADAATFVAAQLVVLNGGHYDEWAAQLAQTSSPGAPVVDALAVSGAEDDHDHEGEGEEDQGAEREVDGDGVNPHLWYSPTAVTAVADAVTATLSELAPEAKAHFDGRRAAFADGLTRYHQLIAAIRTEAAGKTYAATESVFDDMAAAVGLADRTPDGYQVSASNESDPSPADLEAFTRLLTDQGVDVLIYNIQTEGSVPQQLRAAAQSAGIPVVEVTESVAPGAESFQSWQVAQLDALAEALGVAT